VKLFLSSVLYIKILLLLILFTLSRVNLNAQMVAADSTYSSDSLNIPHWTKGLDSIFVIRKIIFEGNNRTRDNILLRELPFKIGDTMSIRKLPAAFEKGRTQLINTSLFHNAVLSVNEFDGQFMDIKITVKERWYIFPFPYFKPVDRNLSQWLFEKGANTARVDYGVKLLYDNLTGNRDNLKFYFITGYTKQIVVSYNHPYIDKSMKWGLNLHFAIGKNHEINYATIDDKQAFLKCPDYIKNFSDANVEATYRKAFYTKHYFGIAYHTMRVTDTVLKLNPDFLSHGLKEVSYPEMYYRIVYQNVDYIPYPTKGYAYDIFFSKKGFNKDMNLWQLTAKGAGNWHLGKGFFYGLSASGTLKLPFNQPFYNKQLLGYGDMFLRGYEYYVIDGVAGGYINGSLNKQVANFSLYMPRIKWFTDKFIPIKIYAKVYGNAGYVYNPYPNRLNNKILFGGGFGFDIVTMYDFNLKLEFSFNQLGENGIYLQKKDIFQ
jgi:hypothetical protein